MQFFCRLPFYFLHLAVLQLDSCILSFLTIIVNIFIVFSPIFPHFIRLFLLVSAYSQDAENASTMSILYVKRFRYEKSRKRHLSTKSLPAFSVCVHGLPRSHMNILCIAPQVLHIKTPMGSKAFPDSPHGKAPAYNSAESSPDEGVPLSSPSLHPWCEALLQCGHGNQCPLHCPLYCPGYTLLP